jgi:hypothetical protein
VLLGELRKLTDRDTEGIGDVASRRPGRIRVASLDVGKGRQRDTCTIRNDLLRLPTFLSQRSYRGSECWLWSRRVPHGMHDFRPVSDEIPV